MTDVIAEGSDPETSGSTGVTSDLQPEELSQRESRHTETPAAVADASVPMASGANEALPMGDQHQPESGDFSENQWDPDADKQFVREEHPPVSLADTQEHLVGRDTFIDIRAGQNNGQIIGQLFEEVQRHSGAPLTREWVDNELKDYLPIGNEGELRRRLQENLVLVLFADHPGSGRWTAALRLLSTAPGNRLTIRRIRRESGDNFTMTGLRRRERTGWILDLRDPDESMPAKADFGHELLQNHDLRTDGSYLVVLASTALWERIGGGASQLAERPESPGPLKLFTAFLDSSGVTEPEAWADRFKPRIGNLRPGQVREWARALISSYSEYQVKNGRTPAADSDADVEKIVETVRNAVSGWMRELAEWHGAFERTSYDRNYLLLAAVYDGAPIDAVHRQVASLAKALGEKGEQSEPLVGQQGPGLILLTWKIKAELLPNGRLRFPGPGFAEAVVQYFWLDRPHLTDAFTRWTVQLSLELKHPLGSQLAQRMAPWVLHHAQATSTTRLLRLVAAEWSEDRNLAEHAHNLLVMASLDPQIGSRVRKAIGAWVTQEGTSAALLRTLALVCKTLTPAHLQMLGRLGDLAHSTKEGVADAVGGAICDLWNDGDLHDRLRETLTLWFSSEQEPLQQAAASAFLYLALQQDGNGQPTLLSEPQTSAPDWVIRGWRTVLEADEPTPLARRAFMAWLDTAATRETFVESIGAALVSAVHDTPTDHLRGQRFLNLVRLAECWTIQSDVVGDQERKKFRRELERRTQQADPHRPGMRQEERPADA
jgi:hypothetical protein